MHKGVQPAVVMCLDAATVQLLPIDIKTHTTATSSGHVGQPQVIFLYIFSVYVWTVTEAARPLLTKHNIFPLH